MHAANVREAFERVMSAERGRQWYAVRDRKRVPRLYRLTAIAPPTDIDPAFKACIDNCTRLANIELERSQTFTGPSP